MIKETTSIFRTCRLCFKISSVDNSDVKINIMRYFNSYTQSITISFQNS